MHTGNSFTHPHGKQHLIIIWSRRDRNVARPFTGRNKTIMKTGKQVGEKKQMHVYK